MKQHLAWYILPAHMALQGNQNSGVGSVVAVAAMATTLFWPHPQTMGGLGTTRLVMYTLYATHRYGLHMCSCMICERLQSL